MVSAEEALRLAEGGLVSSATFDEGDSSIVLTLQTGERLEVPWIADTDQRAAFYNRLGQSYVALTQTSGSGPAWVGDALVGLAFFVGLAVPVALLDFMVVARRRPRGRQGDDLVWLALIVAVPLGALAWLFAGRRRRLRAQGG